MRNAMFTDRADSADVRFDRCGSSCSRAIVAAGRACVPAAIAMTISSFVPALAQAAEVEELDAQAMYCSATVQSLHRACGEEVDSDYWVAFGICINESDDADRRECFSDAKQARAEGTQLCAKQLTGRRNACGLLGEDRYDPPFEQGSFETNFSNLSNPNRYFPLGIGNQWEFRSQTQSIKVQVLNETKLIDDVRCIVVRDEVREQGDLVESTNDWYAQAKDGNVWYCGEETATFESFAGDHPRKPERVSIDGSFKAGRDGDKPGIIFRAAPSPGEAYVEESSLANAEDATVVLSVSYAYGKHPELDQLVPRKLAKLLCAGDCVVTKNFSLLEPGVFERKYYAPGIGVFLEVEPGSGEVVQLVKCNVDPRCASLSR
jgi:hypothetical protein